MLFRAGGGGLFFMTVEDVIGGFLVMQAKGA